MNKEMRKRLAKVMMVQTASRKNHLMLSFIKKFVDNIPNCTITSDELGNLYVTKGTAEFYPCVVAHTDTVHEIYKNFGIHSVIEGKGTANQFECWSGYSSQLGGIEYSAGIGGDDKVGVFIALEMLYQFENIKLAFFVDEEIGCVGSQGADMTFFLDVGYIFQCDRAGATEVIQTSSWTKLFNDDFAEKIALSMEARNYHLSDKGSVTDVLQLADNGVGVCTANIGCGYYKAHTVDEFIVIEDVHNCFKLVVDMIKVLGENQYEYIAEDTNSYANWTQDDETHWWNESYKSKDYYEDFSSVEKPAKTYGSSYSFYSELEINGRIFKLPRNSTCPCGKNSVTTRGASNEYICSTCHTVIYDENDIVEALTKKYGIK